MRMRSVGSGRPLGTALTGLWLSALALGCGGSSPAGDGAPPIATAVAAGAYHTCAVVNGGVQCWGSNYAGGLGTNSTASSLVPVRVHGIASGATAVGAGLHVSCAVVDGGLKCWGHNDLGSVGDGSMAPMQLSPVPVPGLQSGVTAISSNGWGVCAIANGGVHCWGQIQVGVIMGPSVTTPFPVPGVESGVTDVSVGGDNNYAVLNGGAVSWGSGDLQSGRDETDSRETPGPVQGLQAGVTAVAGGSMHACAVVNGGAVCWGHNFFGEIGRAPSTSTVSSSRVPIPIEGLASGVTAIAAGGGFSCAVVGGAAKCWGANTSGHLGDGTMTSSHLPVQVWGLASGVVSISVGDYHVCALTADGAVWCWGENADGQLGDGSRVKSLIPVRVLLL
jgi:trimeric autotransporter adhesin